MADVQVGGKSQLEVTHADKYKIELAKGQRGSYGWTVTTYAATPEQALAQLAEVDSKLREAYGNNGNAE